MATLPTTNLTLADVGKMMDPDGSVAVVSNLLYQRSDLERDSVYVQGNLPTGHRVTVATSLGDDSLRAFNEGIPDSVATTAQFDETVAIIERRSVIDKDLAMLNGNTAAFRMQQSKMALESMLQTRTKLWLYGDTNLLPKGFNGVKTRINSKTAPNATNLLDGGAASGQTDVTSIYLCGWGDETVYNIYPKGSMAGLQREDHGTDWVVKPDGTHMRGLIDWYQWKVGFAVANWQYLVRIHSIDVSVLSGLTGAHAPGVFTNILHLMAQAGARIPNPAMCRPVFYMNRTVYSALQRLAMEKSAPHLTINEGLTQFGTIDNTMRFMGIPIRLLDAIPNGSTVATTGPLSVLVGETNLN